MEIEEQVVQRRQVITLDSPEQAYPEMRDLLANKMSFNSVSEEQYFNDVEQQKIRSKIETMDVFDRYTSEKLEIYLTIDKSKGEMELQIQGHLITEYPSSYSYQKTLWYYAYRSIFDKFLYGHVRHGYEGAVEEKTETLVEEIRSALEH